MTGISESPKPDSIKNHGHGMPWSQLCSFCGGTCPICLYGTHVVSFDVGTNQNFHVSGSIVKVPKFVVRSSSLHHRAR
ncbi:hypothetical protein BC937DRAFT_89179 [Endogone sp. FLAS-F59071]|nr:hypothetical protein BC937DRAFT_89179 [Endogone sp. FLAS-F59071]|eukprot:RUS18070.1 hypothetical protein BC937DRAFT_89179 [Endogone sp. FLAS-F59071]